MYTAPAADRATPDTVMDFSVFATTTTSFPDTCMPSAEPALMLRAEGTAEFSDTTTKCSFPLSVDVAEKVHPIAVIADTIIGDSCGGVSSNVVNVAVAAVATILEAVSSTIAYTEYAVDSLRPTIINTTSTLPWTAICVPPALRSATVFVFTPANEGATAPDKTTTHANVPASLLVAFSTPLVVFIENTDTDDKMGGIVSAGVAVVKV